MPGYFFVTGSDPIRQDTEKVVFSSSDQRSRELICLSVVLSLEFLSDHWFWRREAEVSVGDKPHTALRKVSCGLAFRKIEQEPATSPLPCQTLKTR